MRGETVCTLGGWASKTNKDRGCIHPFNLKRVNPFAGLCHTCRIGNLTSSSAAKVHHRAGPYFFRRGRYPLPRTP